MSDEPAKFILGDTAISAVERRGKGFFRRPREERSPLTNCENCGTPLTGHYCAQCGQPAIDYRRSFRHVIIDILDSFLSWDSKIFHTIGLLIVRPWQLTTEFVAGKRLRYLHPLRLYLLASILFFFAVNYWAKALRVDHKSSPPEARAQIEEQLKRKDLPPPARAALEQALEQMKESPTPTPEATASPQETTTGAAKPEKTPVAKKHRKSAENAVSDENEVIQFGPDKPETRFGKWFQKRAREKIGEHGTNLQLFLRSMISNLPYMMLCSIPLFALILKVLYIRNRILYIDHLIYALHIHTFAYVATISIILITIGLNRVAPGALAGWIIGLLWCAFAVQVFLSIRRVYRQGWIKSFLKFWIGGFVYLVVLLMGFVATLLITLAIP